ncbi:MAG: hypothetical protein ACRD3W_27855, partial [Terriglobales bacterium]
DTAISKDLFQTFGLPVSDTQFQNIQRYNDNRMLEQMFDPEKMMWLSTSTAGLQATSAANSASNMANNQAESAIDFTKKYLTNFTAEANNRWQVIRDQLFIPMAVLLLLPGAVLAQVKALVSQGSPVLGDANPFEGIIRSIVAIFLIPGTFLVINYGIDVANSITFTIADEYRRIFGTDMYQDAVCAQQRAFPSNTPQSNLNQLPPSAAGQGQQAAQTDANGNTVWNPYEQLTLTIRKFDPCANIDQQRFPDETAPWQMQISRLGTNMGNVGLTGAWNVMCAFQMAFLYYLWCIGPIAAALWVWPMGKMRQALPSWIEGVITLCFWSLFWNTVVLLMACFRGVGDSGAVLMSALNWLATYCVQYAFDFSSLVSQGAGGAVQQAMSQAMQGAQGAAQGAGGAKGGAAGAGGGGGAAAVPGSKASAANLGKLNSALSAATRENLGSGLMGSGGGGPHASLMGAHVPGTGLSGGLSPTGAQGLHTSTGGHDPGVPMPPSSAGSPFALSGAAAPGGIHPGGTGPGGTGAGSNNALSTNGIMPSSPPLSGSPGAHGGPGGAGNPLTNPATQNNLQNGLHAGQDALHSNGLGLHMNPDGSLSMNQSATDKMQQFMKDHNMQGDPNQMLQQAMQQAQHGDPSALNNFMSAAQQAGVYDPSTQSALQSMLNSGAVPSLNSSGGLQLDPNSTLALASSGGMPMTGLPNESVLNGAGVLTKPDGGFTQS